MKIIIFFALASLLTLSRPSVHHFAGGMEKTTEKIERESVVRTITSYTLGRAEETDDTPCIGAYNDNLCELADKINICASNEFPKNTKLKIGDIECVVLDRMNPRYSNRIDIATLDYAEAIQFGKKSLPVEIIN